MQTNEMRNRWLAGWQGIVLVAGTYTYFLIFAQFGFLERLNALHLSAGHLKAAMAAMAVGGILASLAAARIGSEKKAARQVQWALAGCAAAAVLTLLPLGLAGGIGVAALIGVSLGTLTVTLVAHLPRWIGSDQPLMKIALGAGVAYFISNVPQLFTASPRVVAITVALLTAVCIPVAQREVAAGSRVEPQKQKRVQENPFWLVLVWFTVLVWFDSAAFYVMQHSQAFRSGAWEGSADLWRTGSIHLVAAVVGAWLLMRRGLVTTLTAAFVLLAGACLFLLHPMMYAWPAAWLYPVGVSFYSVALVAYPAYLLIAERQVRARQAGYLYAVAGWFGSAMGIGMAQHLHQVPEAFVVVAAIVFLAPVVWMARRRYWREMVAIALVGVVSWGVEYGIEVVHPSTPASTETMVERGRHVYISEGCINCHSQYVRPHTRDVLMWGPASNVHAIQKEKPPLIGDRRQGPDLSNVGSRRSPLWLRIHLIDPRAVSPHSIMPSYAYLFRSQRGDELVDYLSSLKSPNSKEHLKKVISTWTPAPKAVQAASRQDGKALYREFCATCHSAHGYARERWGADFKVTPHNLVTAKLKHIPANASPAEEQLDLARIIKFGEPGTNMPGHEYLPSAEIVAMAQWIMHARASSAGMKGTKH